MRYRSVFDGVLVRRMLGAPERSENPAITSRVFPTCHRTPDAGCEIHFLITKKRRAIEWRAMILAAEILGVEQPDAAFLARAHPKLASFICKDRGSDVE